MTPIAIAFFAWLSGCWRGEHEKAVVEECWNEPIGESMSGSFRVVVDGKARLYELLALERLGDATYMRIRHFGPELVPREKEAALSFRLAKSAEREAVFEPQSAAETVKRLVYKRDKGNGL